MVRYHIPRAFPEPWSCRPDDSLNLVLYSADHRPSAVCSVQSSACSIGSVLQAHRERSTAWRVQHPRKHHKEETARTAIGIRKQRFPHSTRTESDVLPRGLREDARTCALYRYSGALRRTDGFYGTAKAASDRRVPRKDPARRKALPSLLHGTFVFVGWARPALGRTRGHKMRDSHVGFA
jgi:hypothetical protein